MNNSLFVRNLSWSVTEQELQSLFQSVGGVQEVSIPQDRATGRPRGFAFITMDSVESATKAIQQLSDTMLGDRNIVVDYQDPNKGSRKNSALVTEGSGLFLKGLPYNADEASLGDWLSTAGNVLNVSIPTDRETGDVRGFAFIDMASTDDAANVIQQLNGQAYNGQTLQIRYKNDDRRGGSGGGNRRSHSGGRDNYSYGGRY
jgi:nucleolin